jgi:alcohol dehydrogenase class IV
MFNACNPLLLCDAAAVQENRVKALSAALLDADMRWGVVESPPAGSHPDVVQALAAIYRDRDHDALMVMGGGALTDLAKLVNVAVSTGQDDPDFLADGYTIEERLQPMVLIAQAQALGFETSGWVRTGQAKFCSLHLMPDLAVVDARTVGSPEANAMIDTGLVALAVGTENLLDAEYNPMAVIYATNAVQAAMVTLQSITGRSDKAFPYMQAANAAVMAGCALADRMPGELIQLGYHLAETDRILFPAVLGGLLPAAAKIRIQGRDLVAGNLLTALLGINRSASTPRQQRPLHVIATLAALANDLYDFSEGFISRTLHEAGFAPDELPALAESFVKTVKGADLDAVKAILQGALNGDL